MRAAQVALQLSTTRAAEVALCLCTKKAAQVALRLCAKRAAQVDLRLRRYRKPMTKHSTIKVDLNPYPGRVWTGSNVNLEYMLI